MKRANRHGLSRSAAVTLGVGTTEDIPVFEAAFAHDEPLVREPAMWARAQARVHDAMRR